MTLYEMTAAAASLYAMLNDELIDEQTVADTLESVGIEGKLEDYCKVIRQLEADAQMYKDESDRLTAKRRTAERGVERLIDAIKTFMKVTGAESSKAGVFDLKMTHSMAVAVVAEDQIPTAYRIAQPDKIDKAGIRKALLNGEQIDGAALIVNDNIKIK